MIGLYTAGTGNDFRRYRRVEKPCLTDRTDTMHEETMNVAEAKKHFSEILSQVAFGKKNIIITKRGKPMARLIPVEDSGKHLSDARGWLEDDDPFFKTIEKIVENRSSHIPRIIRQTE